MDFKSERSVRYQISSFYMYLQPQIGTECTNNLEFWNAAQLSHHTWELSCYHLCYRDFAFYISNLGFYQYTRGALWWMWHTWSIWGMALLHHIPTITKALHALRFGGKTYSISTTSLKQRKQWVASVLLRFAF